MSHSSPLPSGLFNKREAAAYLHIGVRTLERWVAAGLITPRKIGPKPLTRFAREDLDTIGDASSQAEADE